MSDERVPLSFDEAMARIADGDHVHVTTNPAPGMLLGADWSRSAVEDHIRQFPAELSGPLATANGHGVCSWDGRWVFFATKPDDAEMAAHAAIEAVVAAHAATDDDPGLADGVLEHVEFPAAEGGGA